MDKSEAAWRLVEGFTSPLRGFIIDPSIDDPSIFVGVLRAAGVGSLVSVDNVPGSHLRIVTLNTRPCESRCRYEECPDGDAVCLGACVSRCVEERVRQIVSRLETMYGVVDGPRQVSR